MQSSHNAGKKWAKPGFHFYFTRTIQQEGCLLTVSHHPTENAGVPQALGLISRFYKAQSITARMGKEFHKIAFGTKTFKEWEGEAL
jgi:hypothetical protein